MRAVVTVIGKDAVGILAKVSTKCGMLVIEDVYTIAFTA